MPPSRTYDEGDLEEVAHFDDGVKFHLDSNNQPDCHCRDDDLEEWSHARMCQRMRMRECMCDIVCVCVRERNSVIIFLSPPSPTPTSTGMLFFNQHTHTAISAVCTQDGVAKLACDQHRWNRESERS